MVVAMNEIPYAPRSLVDRLPGLASLQAETLGDPRVVIAMLDGPVDRAHECFLGADVTTIETLAGHTGSGAAVRHGTHVASILFGQPGSPVPGLAPRCKGLLLPVFSEDARGEIVPSSQLDVARAITQAISSGARIINLSGGQLAASGEAEWVLADAIRQCAASDVILVAAAGNEGCECLHVPAATPSVLVVGAMDDNGNPSSFSNWNDAYHGHGILAPGEAIPGAAPGGGVEVRSGTSYAAPIVTGVLALLMSRELQRGRPIGSRELVALLLNGAIGCQARPVDDCRLLLSGRLSVVSVEQSFHKRGIQMTDQKEQIKEASDLAETPLRASAPLPRAGLTGIRPSDCGCSGGGGASAETKPALGYVIGQLGFDFVSEARRDSLTQQADGPLNDTRSVLDYLAKNPWDAASIIWTIGVDQTPLYAIQPYGPFAAEAYKRLQEFLADAEVERIAIPGFVQGSVRLLSGQKLPAIFPELRGMASWSTAALVKSVRSAAAVNSSIAGEVVAFTSGGSGHEGPPDHALTNFVERVYYELRNLGLSSQDRAINFAATNAFQVERVFTEASLQNLNLQSIDVEKSPICRPSSDCWDVKLVFFDPRNKTEVAQRVFRLTVDVSDVVPVTVGKIRSWNTY